MKRFLILLILGIPSFSFSQKNSFIPKEKIIELYQNLYLSSEIDSIKWNGNIDQCICGSLRNEIYKKVEDRVNFFRRVNRLNMVKINTDFNKEAQEAALLILANNQLTHYPNHEMKCFSTLSKNGCFKSSLGFSDFKNYPHISFITGFINDYGAENYFVGHRKWILYSKLDSIGYGATHKSEALLTYDGVNFTPRENPKFIAYPWNGFVPFNLIFPKWSFSIPEEHKVDYSKTEIQMIDEEGEVIEIKKLKEYKNHLDHTIVWIATGLFTPYEIEYSMNDIDKSWYLNKKIKVKILNVRVDDEIKNFEYFVVPIKP